MVAEGMFTLIENFSDHDDAKNVDNSETESAHSGNVLPKHRHVSSGWPENAVLCVGARGSLDDVTAAILVQLLQRRGIRAQMLTSDEVAPATLGRADITGVRLIVVSYMNEDSVTHAKYLIRRLRRRAPTAKVMIAFWSMTADQLAKSKIVEATQADFATVSLTDAVGQITTAAVTSNKKRTRTSTAKGRVT
jgi:hypothetical protein